MVELVAELNALLCEQNEQIHLLLDLGGQETKALQNNDLEQLSSVVGQQEVLGEKLELLERKRRRLEEKLGEKLHLEEVTVSSVLSLLDEKTADELQEIRQVLQSNYLKLQEINEVNTLLIQQGLSYVNRMQQVLAGGREKAYGREGVKNSDSSTTAKVVDKTV